MTTQTSIFSQPVTPLTPGNHVPIQEIPFFKHHQRVNTPHGEGTVQYRTYIQDGSWVYVVSFPAPKDSGKMWVLREYAPQLLTAAKE